MDIFPFFKKVLDSHFKKIERLKPSEWQEKYRVNPPGSPIPGKWHNFCYQVEMFDAPANSSCRCLIMKLASQLLGKTSVIEGILAWRIHQKPGTTFHVFPSMDNAEAWSKNRFGPMIESCEVLRSLVDTSDTRRGIRSGYGSNTMTHKKFPGGWWLGTGSNSSSQLRSHTAEWIFFDEIDAYKSSVDNQGDPIIQARQRSVSYRNSFSIETSTPTFLHFSRIDKSYEMSDQRKWFNICPKCNNKWIIKFSDIKWTKTKNEQGKTVHHISEAWLQCPFCAVKLTEAERVKMINESQSKGGGWIITRPEIKDRWGFESSAFITLRPLREGYKSWMHDFAGRWLEALVIGEEGIKDFMNLICGESYESPAAEPPDYEVLFNRREEYPEYDGEIVIPERALAMYVGADTQDDRVEAEIFCIGKGEECWGIEYRIFYGNPALPAFWNEFDEWTMKKWRHHSGHMMWPACVCIDSQGHHADDVYSYVHRCGERKVYATRGRRDWAGDWVTTSQTKKRLLILKVDSPKETLYTRLRLTEYGPRYQHFPSNSHSGYGITYFKQLCSEVMRHTIRGAQSCFRCQDIWNGSSLQALSDLE